LINIDKSSEVDNLDDKDPVTVIIVNFNSGVLLSKCVNSVLSSDTPVNVIVVDNNSQDDSIESMTTLFRKEKRLTLIRNSVNTGFAHASNQALKQAKGKYWLFLNPDCMIQQDTIHEMCVLMDKNPDVAMSGPLILNPDGSEQRGCRRSIPTPWHSFISAFGLSKYFRKYINTYQDFSHDKQPLPSEPVDVEAISGAFMLVRQSAIDEIGLLDEGYFLHCEDLDWCMRILQKGWRILFATNTVITHTKGGCSKDRKIFVLWHMHKGMVRFYSKFFKDKYPGSLMWLVVTGVWIRFIALAGFHAIKNTIAGYQTVITKVHAHSRTL